MATVHMNHHMKVVPFSTSKVDIIIPFHGQYEKVIRLIESIILITKSNPYQITLVDDCSGNKNFGKSIHEQFLKTTPDGFLPQVQCIRTQQHMGFGGALRAGYDATKQPWVCFLHSDCVVEDQNWLISMGQSLLKWKNAKLPVKMVSARTDHPGEDAPKELKADKQAKDNDIILNDGHLPLYCALCHRDLFYRIGGFVKPYPYAWYEDVELAARMKYFGFQQGVCGKSWVRHEGGATINTLWNHNPEARHIMEENRNRAILDMRRLA